MAEGIFIPDMVEVDDGGVAADHPPKLTLPVLVAPFEEARKTLFNAVRRSLVTVACKDVLDSHYAFDSSVLHPEAKNGFAQLKGLIDRHPKSPLSIFGHADSEGDPTYNKFLSERRAEAVFGMLIRDVPTWERLFSDHQHTPGDVWGDPAVALMLSALGFESNGTTEKTLGDVIRRYQRDRGIAPLGRNDVGLRAKLFAEYMDFLCSDPKGVPFKLTKADFLGAGDEHGAFQGCSFFNPRLVLAGSEEREFEQDKAGQKEAHHAKNVDNRRAIIFFFQAGATIDPKKWPCPRAKQGINGCVHHFWSDGNERRQTRIENKRRRFGKAVRNHTERIAQIEKTFACRFYHGLALHSPCEGDLQMWVLQIMVDAPHRPGVDVALKPLANTRYVVLADGGRQTSPVLRGTTSANGIIGIPLWIRDVTMLLKLDIFSAVVGDAKAVEPKKNKDGTIATVKSIDLEAPDVAAADDATDPFKDEKDFFSFPLSGTALVRIQKKSDPPGTVPEALEPDADEPVVAPDEQNLGARQRLFNLGYGVANPATWTDAQFAQFVKRYQKDKKLKQDGTLSDETIKSLRKEYGC